MKKELIQSLTKDFESFARETDNDVEFWLARDLQHLLGYTKWDNFQSVISKAKTACEVSEHDISDHFAGVGKTIKMPNEAEKTIDDYMLTRYACYLIAQNADSRKEEIAFAQTYFALQTRKMEIIEQKLLESERVTARHKLAETEKELSSVIYEQTKCDKNFASIRSKGDKAFFSYSTQGMKEKWNVPKGRALADFAPTIILKAKDFATEITIYNAKENKMSTEREISSEHITNNRTIRKALLERGIQPEALPPEEDVKKVERKLKSDTKKGIKNPDILNS
ncbi:MAG: DNA damage-inducible protein D [Candidatus Peribacteraceae bacterium]|nr:DNA damage-inducible protein D [Candidatus Peribacteraceae bacterium]